MEAIFPSSALSKKQPEVKKAAREDVVRITEHGEAAFIFCSEKVFEEKLRKAAADAAYEASLSLVIQRGRADRAAGRVYHGSDEAFAEIENRIAQHD